MNINVAEFPQTLDMLHLILAVISMVLLIIVIVKSKKPAQADISQQQPAIQPVEKSVEENKKESPQPEKQKPETIVLKEATPDAALQVLALLQQEARFIDFIQEDLTGFSDADIGAAARVVHEGSKKTINHYFDLQPIRTEDEESKISVPQGFNASEIRLTGNVTGEAPFNGVLLHKGWKVSNIKLPKLAENHDASIVAPAEVEL